MSPVRLLAAFVCGLVIWQLFRLNREEKVKTSLALWIPTLWIFVGATRNLSVWLSFSSDDSGQGGYLEGNPIDQVGAALMLGIGILVLVRRGRQVIELLQSNKAVVLFFSYCAVSAIWSDFPEVSIKRGLRAIGDIVMVLLVLSETNRLTAIRRVLARVGYVSIPMSILFIRYFPELGRVYSRGGLSTWSGVASGKNGLGMICLVFGLAFLYRFFEVYQEKQSPERRRTLLAQLVILAMVFYLLFQAHSATSYAVFFLAGGPMAMVCLFRWARRPAIVHTMVASVTAVAASALFLNVGGGMLAQLGRDSTLTGRTDIWRSAFSLVENPIVGTGFESFWLGERLAKMEILIDQRVNQAHDGYIEIYLNLGVVGVILLLFVLLVAYGRVVRAVEWEGLVAGLSLAYFIANVTYNFTEAAFKMMHPLWIGLFLMSMAKPSPPLPADSPPVLTPSIPRKRKLEPKPVVTMARRLR